MTFDDRITIQQDSSNDDDPIQDYSSHAFAEGVPCKVIDVRGQDTYRGNQLASLSEYVVEMWHLASVTTDMRVYVDEGIQAGKTLNIVHVKDLRIPAKPQMTTLFCKAYDA